MGEHHQHDHDHHGHDHAADDPAIYAKAGWVGVGGFLSEGIPGFAVAGSLGAVGDALHALTDAASFFISARHARLQREHAGAEVDYERRSVVMQTAFLVLAIVLMVANIWLGSQLIELSSKWMLVSALFGLGFNIWQMQVLGRSRREGVNRHEMARQHAFIDVLYSVVVLHGAILIFFIKVDGWVWVKVPAILGLVFLVSVAFVTTGFVDFEEFSPRRKALYVLASIVGAILSVLLVMHGEEKVVDLAVGLFLLAAMLASLSRNLLALVKWESGGRRWVHVH
jgi:cobalt-zinc-cadmium efflux system protein